MQFSHLLATWQTIPGYAMNPSVMFEDLKRLGLDICKVNPATIIDEIEFLCINRLEKDEAFCVIL